MYADETGNLDYGSSDGASAYFGVGTATVSAGHGRVLAAGEKLRAEVTKFGIAVPNGFHAHKDSAGTRKHVLGVVAVA